MDFVEKVKGFLMEPSKTFDASKQDTLEDALKYYAVIIAVYSLLSTVMFTLVIGSLYPLMGLGRLGMMGIGAGIGGAIAIFIMMLVAGIINAFLSGVIVHIGVLIVGGKNGITQTIKAVIYGFTPFLLFGWIPVINLIAGLWSLVLEVIGIRQLHGITTGRAVIAIIIPLAIITVLAIIFAAVIAAFVFGIGGSY